jgi:hypothetical protein
MVPVSSPEKTPALPHAHVFHPVTAAAVKERETSPKLRYAEFLQFYPALRFFAFTVHLP